MTFADRAILVGLVALAIPLVVHLLGRRRPRRVALPTARFAEGAHAASRGRLWLKRLGLLALRLAAVALVVLALAGPRLGGGSAPAGRWILVLDASPSMRMADAAGVSALERSRTRLARVLGALDEAAEVTLALSDGRGAAGSPEEVRRSLEAMADPGWRSDPLGPAIREALAARETAAEGRPARLVLATDATPAALADLAPGAFAEADVEVTLLATTPAEANVWLGIPTVAVTPQPDGRGHVLEVSVEARGAGGEPFRVELDLEAPDLRAVSDPFTRPGQATFRQPVPGPGPWQGHVRVQADDGLTLDNVRYFSAAAAQAARVLVVDAAEEPDVRVRSADLVAAAFAGETDAPKQVVRRPVEEVKRTDTVSADVVFWVGSGAPADGSVLAEIPVPVVWMPAAGKPPAPPLAEALGLPLGEAETVSDGATIDPAGYTSDLLAAFEGGTSGDLAAPVFRQRLRAAGGADGTGVVVRFRDGAPAILDGQGPGGRVVSLTVGPAPVWGDLASRAEWVVLAHSLVEALASAGETRVLNLTVAQAAEAGLPGFLGKPGNYTGTDAADRPVHYSVNLAPAETADLKADLAGLRSAFAEGRCRVVSEEVDPLKAIPGLSGGSGRDLTPLVALLLAAVLVAEGLVAWWASGGLRKRGEVPFPDRNPHSEENA